MTVLTNFDNLHDFIIRNQTPWVLPLDGAAIIKIFKEGSPALFLFSKESLDKRALEEISPKIRGNVQLVYGDITSVHHLKLAKSLGLAGIVMPFALILDQNFQKYLLVHDTSSTSLLKFYDDWKEGLLKPYYKSEENIIIEDNLIKLTGKSFYEYRNLGNLLVQFYIPNCGYCRMLMPEYEIVADTLKHITVSYIDYSSNDIEGYTFNEFPKIFYFPKEKPEGIEYNGNWVAKEIISFVLSNNSTNTVFSRTEL